MAPLVAVDRAEIAILIGPLVPVSYTHLDVYKRQGVRVVPDDSFVCNRSLDGSAFSRRTGYVPPSWDVMLDELAEDIRNR